MANHFDAVLGGILTQDKHVGVVYPLLSTACLFAMAGTITPSDGRDVSHAWQQNNK